MSATGDNAMKKRAKRPEPCIFDEKKARYSSIPKCKKAIAELDKIRRAGGDGNLWTDGIDLWVVRTDTVGQRVAPRTGLY